MCGVGVIGKERKGSKKMKGRGSGKASKSVGRGRKQAPVATPEPVPAPKAVKPNVVGTPVPNIAVARDPLMKGVVSGKARMPKEVGRNVRKLVRFEDGSMTWDTRREQAQKAAVYMDRVWKRAKAGAGRLVRSGGSGGGVKKAKA